MSDITLLHSKNWSSSITQWTQQFLSSRTASSNSDSQHCNFSSNFSRRGKCLWPSFCVTAYAHRHHINKALLVAWVNLPAPAVDARVCVRGGGDVCVCVCARVYALQISWTQSVCGEFLVLPSATDVHFNHLTHTQTHTHTRTHTGARRRNSRPSTSRRPAKQPRTDPPPPSRNGGK